MNLVVCAVIADLWLLQENLFRPEPKLGETLSRDERNQHLKNEAEALIPPGLIALKDGDPVGWGQATPRTHVLRWNTARTLLRPLAWDNPEDPGLWAISCFFIQSRRRGQGLSHALVESAVSQARQGGARILEACPVEQTRHSGPVGLLAGSLRVFEKAGFETVAERLPRRPLMLEVLA
ncbi:acetyltransferase (GNAT) family protein [Hoeflea halophila]|uniref:Acetyltransferase (GNAT) family protein n=1 Tax=Hoeflea halophila TaxID=714899 RepID=A0A286IB55_9HYPH|nr:GNAT family N-acetyltransferase [Hoeflea halophila]SOE17302.1 acetyltransferase (GNAT) family protein [Hoeflea halophila]